MNNKVKIAVDAMGGENAPRKIIKGINISLKKNRENYFYLFGNKDLINEEIDLKSQILLPFLVLKHKILLS